MAVTTINEKLEEAVRIKKQIQAAAATKDVDFPEETPFANYPKIIAKIPGHLQEKTITPTAAGGVVSPDDGYDGFSSVTLPAEPDLIPKAIIAGNVIFGVIGTAEAPTFDVGEFFGRTLEELVSGVTKIGEYAFFRYTALKKCEFQNLLELGQNAFQNCTSLQTFIAPLLTEIPKYAFQNCTALSVFDLSKIEKIDDYGFDSCKKISQIGVLTASIISQYGARYLGYDNAEGFEYTPSQPAVIGNNGLQYAKLTCISGEIKSVGSSGLNSLGTQFTKFKCTIDGPVYSYGLADNQYVKELDFSKSRITSIGSYAFNYLGWNRSDYATQRLKLDFRNSIFQTVEQYALGYSRYTDIYLPKTVKTINSYAFNYGNNINIYMGEAAAPNLSATNCFSNATNYKVFIPYHYLHSYDAIANWTAIAANLVGYAPAGKWDAEITLPTVNGEGYELTWYSDIEKTTQITSVPDGSPELYCAIGDKVKSVITISKSDWINLDVVDSDGNTYDYSEGFVLVDTDTVLSISVNVEEGYESYIKIGNEKVTEYPYTFTVEGDMSMRISAWDPNAINPDFATATWEELSIASKNGSAEAIYGNQVGATREITLNNGKSFMVRLANCTSDMYDLADGSGKTGFVLEFADCWPDTKYMNTSSTNSGGWNGSYMRKTVMPLIWEQLPDDLKNVIAKVKIKAAQSGSNGTLPESEDTLFLPAEREIFGNCVYSRTEEWNALQRWQYYEQNDTDVARVKQRSGNAAWWWLRSPRSGSSNNFVSVNSGGSVSYAYANLSGGVAPSFCI